MMRYGRSWCVVVVDGHVDYVCDSTGKVPTERGSWLGRDRVGVCDMRTKFYRKRYLVHCTSTKSMNPTTILIRFYVS